MANRWKGNFVVATEATSSGTDYTGKANGAWGLNSQLQQKQGNLWAAGVGAPSTPTIGTATAAPSQASITFTGGSTGGGTVTYTATSTPSGITGTSATSPITVTNLTNGTAYTFTVRASNNLGYTSAESGSSNSVTPNATAIAITGWSSPYINTYLFSDGSGFGTTFSAPATTLGAQGNGVVFSPNNSQIVGGSWIASGSGLKAYPWGGSGFGTAYADPATTIQRVTGVTFNSTGSVLACGSGNTPYIAVYNWSSSGFGTKWTDPATLPASRGNLKFKSGNSYLSVAHDTTPFITTYSISGTAFGSKVANPSSLPVGAGTGVTFIGDNVFLSVKATPYIQGYPFTTGYGTKYANPSILATDYGYGIASNPAGDTLALASTVTPFILLYPWTGSAYGTKWADPVTLPTGTAGNPNGNCIAFSASGNTIAITNATASPYVATYPFSSSTGVGTKYADPSTALPTWTQGVAFTN